jgi:hypothetical protein
MMHWTTTPRMSQEEPYAGRMPLYVVQPIRSSRPRRSIAAPYRNRMFTDIR